MLTLPKVLSTTTAELLVVVVITHLSSPQFLFFHRNVSGLPFYDVMVLENLPKSASLPVATSQEAKRRIRSGFWDFDYVFYTESDQVWLMCVGVCFSVVE